MRGAVLPLLQYAFMAWCSVKEAQGQLYLLPLCYHSVVLVYAEGQLYLTPVTNVELVGAFDEVAGTFCVLVRVL
jgi:hypothetical protein